MRWLLLALALSSCVDVNRGALVVLKLRAAVKSNEAGQHYALYGVVNGGAVLVERFKVLDNLADCGFDPETASPVQLVQRYDEGASMESLCDTGRRLGNVDKIDTSTATLVGGVRIETDVDLSDAERLFVSVEVDGDADPTPGTVAFGADLADGVAPYAPRARECRETTCAALDPMDPLFEQLCGRIPDVPRTRRGVRLGILLREPLPADDCNAVDVGEAAVVPAEDETFL